MPLSHSSSRAASPRSVRWPWAAVAVVLLAVAGAIGFASTWPWWSAVSALVAGVAAVAKAMTRPSVPPARGLSARDVRPWWVDDDDLDSSEDAFHRLDFVDGVVRILDDVAGDPSSLVIGLVGPWGSGKSTTLRWLEQRIEQRDDWQVVRMGAWAASGPDAVTLELLRVLNAALGANASRGRQELVRRIARNILPALGAIAPAAEGLPVVGPLAKVGWASLRPSATAEPLDAQIRQLADIARKNSTSTLVVVDDLDRLERGELLALLKAVRVLGRLPGVNYVLVYDEARLLQQLDGTSEAALDGRRAVGLLEKVVTLPLLQPPGGRDDVETMLRRRLEAAIAAGGTSLNPDLEQRLDEEVSLFFADLITTPRDVVRFAAQLHAYLPLVGSADLDVLDFAVLTLLRLRYNRLYDALALDRYALVTREHGVGDAVRTSWRDGDPVGQTDVPRVEQGAVRGALRRLFPQSIGGTPYKSGEVVRTTYEAWPRVSDPLCTETYFRLVPPVTGDDGALAQVVLDELDADGTGPGVEQLVKAVALARDVVATGGGAPRRPGSTDVTRAVRLVRRASALTRNAVNPITSVHLRAVLDLFPLVWSDDADADLREAVLSWLAAVLDGARGVSSSQVANEVDAVVPHLDRAQRVLALTWVLQHHRLTREDIDELRREVPACAWRTLIAVPSSTDGPDRSARALIDAVESLAPHTLDSLILDSLALDASGSGPASLDLVTVAAIWMASTHTAGGEDPAAAALDVIRIAGPAKVRGALRKAAAGGAADRFGVAVGRRTREALTAALERDAPEPLPRGVERERGPLLDPPRPLDRLEASNADIGFLMSAFIETPADADDDGGGSATRTTWDLVVSGLTVGDPLSDWLMRVRSSWGDAVADWTPQVGQDRFKVLTAQVRSARRGAGAPRTAAPVNVGVQISRAERSTGPAGLYLVCQVSVWMRELDDQRHPTDSVQHGEPLPAALTPTEVAELVDACVGWLLDALQRSRVLLSLAEQSAPVRLDVRSTGGLNPTTATKLPVALRPRKGALASQLHASWLLERTALPAARRQVSRLTDLLLRQWLDAAGARNPDVVTWR